MLSKYITEFCTRIEFPDEATKYFVSCLSELSEENLNDIKIAVNEYLHGSEEETVKILNKIASDSQIHIYSIETLFMLICSEKTHEMYVKRGLSEEMFTDTMKDITVKMIECKKLHDIWGIFVFDWFRSFFQCKRFKIGRLQYENANCTVDYNNLKIGDPIINVHIPSGGKLLTEDVLNSLRSAYKFYGYSGIMPIICYSWLLYKPFHEKVFAPGSNIRAFRDLFDVVKNVENTNREDLWRVYYMPNDTALDKLPQNTTLQKNMHQFLSAGNNMGAGIGIMLFDGEKIVNR